METENKRISITVPSRGRSNDLIECVESYLGLSENPKLIDVGIKVDLEEKNDYEFSLKYLSEKFPGSIKTCFMDRGLGIYDMPRYCDELVSNTTGDIIVWASDDVTISTKGWDTILLTSPIPIHGLMAFAFHWISGEGDRVTAHTRKLWDVLGKYPSNRNFDSDISELMGALKLRMTLPIEIVHKQRESFYIQQEFQSALDKLKNYIRIAS